MITLPRSRPVLASRRRRMPIARAWPHAPETTVVIAPNAATSTPVRVVIVIISCRAVVTTCAAPKAWGYDHTPTLAAGACIAPATHADRACLAACARDHRGYRPQCRHHYSSARGDRYHIVPCRGDDVR